MHEVARLEPKQHATLKIVPLHAWGTGVCILHFPFLPPPLLSQEKCPCHVALSKAAPAWKFSVRGLALLYACRRGSLQCVCKPRDCEVAADRMMRQWLVRDMSVQEHSSGFTDPFDLDVRLELSQHDVSFFAGSGCVFVTR